MGLGIGNVAGRSGPRYEAGPSEAVGGGNLKRPFKGDTVIKTNDASSQPGTADQF